MKRGSDEGFSVLHAKRGSDDKGDKLPVKPSQCEFCAEDATTCDVCAESCCGAPASWKKELLTKQARSCSGPSCALIHTSIYEQTLPPAADGCLCWRILVTLAEQEAAPPADGSAAADGPMPPPQEELTLAAAETIAPKRAAAAAAESL